MYPTRCGLLGDYANGNGSLMRILPFVLYGYFRGYFTEEAVQLVHTASSLTHGHVISLIGCGIYTLLIRSILRQGREGIQEGLRMASAQYEGWDDLAAYARIFEEDFAALPRESIRSTGYVVDTLEAAVWCLLTTDNYRDCVLKAANLGEDTDTVAAIAGGLAGALYGMEGIPARWLDTLIRREFIEEMCDRAAKNWVN
jgi:ADP-ribosylglycohydrolase